MDLEQIRTYLRNQIAQARLILFAGAGLSAGAKDLDGRPLPLGTQLQRELWELCFPGEAYEEGATLQDVYQEALRSRREELTTYLTRRFSVDAASLPDYYRLWFSVPWRRVYTTNVDDLIARSADKFELPRQPLIWSATRGELDALLYSDFPRKLVNIHLHGTLDDIPDYITFSRTQYGVRLGNPDPWYVHLVNDINTLPTVFVGAQMEEPPFWQYVTQRGARGQGAKQKRARSLLVSPKLDRARQGSLAELNIEWVPMTAEEFAREVFEPLRAEITAGNAKIVEENDRARTNANEVPDLEALVRSAPQLKRSLFLLGREPTWVDFQDGYAIPRTIDAPLLAAVLKNVSVPADRETILVTGTAGSGKSTAMHRLALALMNEGISVGWVASDHDIGPREILQHISSGKCQKVLMIDSADRYGSSLASIVNDLNLTVGGPTLVLSLRGTKVDRVLPAGRLRPHVKLQEFGIPPLSDDDISMLLDALADAGLLGVLRALSRAEQVDAFRAHANRQLLVALYQATFGKRFEEKVADEYQELTEPGRGLYALVAIATSLGFSLTRDDLLIAWGSSSNDELNAIDALMTRGVLVQFGGDSRFRARHKLIAEVLVAHLSEIGIIGEPLRRLAWMAANKVGPHMKRGALPWRLVKALINHRFLYERIQSVEGVRIVYDGIREALEWDYHFWLQRGSFETEKGLLDLAENYLQQARTDGSSDPIVATAWAHLLLKRAAERPGMPSAPADIAEGKQILLERVHATGYADSYPVHILGSQGLSWARRGPLTIDQKRDWLEFLCDLLKEARKHHAKADDLRKLHDDLTRERLALALPVKSTP